MTDRSLRFGMIGAGNHSSQSIYPALRFTNLELVAVAELDEDRARTRSTRFGNPRIYADYDEMLKIEELEAVGVVGPPELHHEAGLAVVDSGRHLFVEKPPAADLAGARELQALAAERGVQVMVGFMKRHASAYARAHEISQRPEFGRRTVLRLNYSHFNIPPRDHIIYMCTHALDLVRFFMGDVERGSVIKRDINGSLVLAMLTQHTDGGASHVTLSAHEPRVQESMELAGESALIQVHNLTDFRYHPASGTSLPPDEHMVSMWYPEFTIPVAEQDNHILQGYAGELREFGEAIASGRPMTPNIDDGVEAMRLAEALFDAPEGLSDLLLPD